MSSKFSAKALLNKAKEIQELEDAKREAEIKAQKEKKKIEAQLKKFNQEFINQIGVRCIEKALENEAHCLINDAELEKFQDLIKKCGLNIETLKLTADEIEEDYPDLYEELQIEDELEAILNQLDQLTESDGDFIDENSHLLDEELAEYNDQLYEIFESIRDDGWHLTLVEKAITEEIECSGISPSFLYEDDEEMYVAIVSFLDLLKKYKKNGIRNHESDLASDATLSIGELIREIPTLTRALEEHKSKLSKLKESSNRDNEYKESQIEKLVIAKENLLNKYHQINIISWSSGDKVSHENSFLNPKNLRWIMNNPLMEDLFKFIEKKILDKSKSCEIIFKSFGPRSTHEEFLSDGLFFDDFLVEISIDQMKNIFSCLGYETQLTSNKPTKDGPSNLLQTHTLKISWPVLQ